MSINSNSIKFQVFSIKFLSLIPILFLLSTVSIAQPKDNDPFSRIGLGTLLSQEANTSAAMGGLGAVYHDKFYLNMVNPASVAFLKLTSFEVGGYATYSKLQGQTTNTEAWGGNISNISLGFPIQNPLNKLTERKVSPVTWGMGLALQPYSQVAYDITYQLTAPDTINVFNEGTGGTYKVAWNNAWKYKNFSVGIGLGYMFGKINNVRVESFENYPLGYDNRLEDAMSIGGVVWNAGLMYEHIFKQTDEEKKNNKPKQRLTIGIYGNSGSTINSETSATYMRVSLFSGNDTLVTTSDVEGEIQLPAEFGAGLMYVKDNRYRFGINYQSAAWSNYKNDARPDIFENAFKFSVGGEVTPDYRAFNNYFKKISYRFGLFYGKDPRNVNGQLNSVGGTIGFGLPLKVQRGVPSFLNLMLELGKLGGDENLLSQNYGRVSLSFTLNDNSWFYRRKFE